ncbi:SET domain-containing protein [Melanomma pulvis-pyrius CBS 109.77]|uniref:SET domain-containing protein n=1 Tax=Melanomma pulvis-pyrius CBS 109.77 TaxID=1314802 RepID=A0A6A6XWW5_9PLEO|nr:SET domain-containing protein [Melanomma pulvis-pyrius CBS 109.77]
MHPIPTLLSPSFPISLLLLISHLHPTSATVGVVNIDELLLSPEHPQFLSSSPPPKHNPHAPWSHKPHCKTSASLSSLNQKYCAFTSNTTGANGLSIITTPSLAETAAPFFSEDPLSHFLTQDQAEYLYYNAPPYEIVDHIPGKGKGVVATRLIKKYETFMVDQATVVMDLALEKSMGAPENLELLRTAVQRLRRPESVSGLSGKHNGAKDGEGKEEEAEDVTGGFEEDIMMTNAFGTTVAGESFRGLFPLVSRINHACNPNAFVLFSQAGISIAIKAYRDIQPGEEISISYLLLGLPSADRTEGLKRWGFTCTCALCTQGAAEKAASDARRRAIAGAEPHIQALWKQGKLNGAIKLAEEIVQHMKDEAIMPMLTDQYANLARMFLLQGDKQRADEYGELALELLGDLGFLGTEWEGEWDLERLLAVLGERGEGGMYAQ